MFIAKIIINTIRQIFFAANAHFIRFFQFKYYYILNQISGDIQEKFYENSMTYYFSSVQHIIQKHIIC